MNIRTVEVNGLKLAVVNSSEKLLSNMQSALDFMMSVQYESGANRIILYKEEIAEDFFILSTRLAGDILQKFINYHIKLAIIGDFSTYTSKPLRDFIYESNNGKDFFFVSSEDQAIKKLSNV